MTGNDASNIKVYQKKKHVNVGIIIFGVVFIYLVMTVLLYLTAQHISVYEVREGSILRDNSYTGLALRNETVIRSDRKGICELFRIRRK
ncbi:MAG: HlyD family efflux transporter periplasmic adaptor subunit [Dorea sp.]